MSDKSAAWFRQADHDLSHARVALAAGDYDWACQAAGEAAAKAIKAVLVARNAKVLGAQNLVLLLDQLQREAGLAVPEERMEDARTLMLLLGVLSAQCTYGGVAPFELISRPQAESAIAAAERLCARMNIP